MRMEPTQILLVVFTSAARGTAAANAGNHLTLK